MQLRPTPSSGLMLHTLPWTVPHNAWSRHSAPDRQDRQRPSRQIPLQCCTMCTRAGTGRPLIHRWPHRAVQVQMAAQCPRSQYPSPHSPSFVQSRSGTFWDQARLRACPVRSSQSSAIAWSSGVNPSAAGGGPSCVPFTEATGTGARGGGCAMCPPAGAPERFAQDRSAMGGGENATVGAGNLPVRKRPCLLPADQAGNVLIAAARTWGGA
jgi:hypothetical protein